MNGPVYRHVDKDGDILSVETLHPEAKLPPGTFALTVEPKDEETPSATVYVTTEQVCEIANLLAALTLIPTTAEEIDQWLKS